MSAQQRCNRQFIKDQLCLTKGVELLTQLFSVVSSNATCLSQELPRILQVGNIF